MTGRIEKFLTLILLIWAISATTIAVNLYLENQSYRDILYSFGSKTISVNLLIDYGNGTKAWFNNTIVPRNSTLFTLLLTTVKINYTTGKYGVFIKSVNNVSNKVTSSSSGRFWMWYYYDKKNHKWVSGPVAVDKWPLKNGDILKIVYKEVKW